MGTLLGGKKKKKNKNKSQKPLLQPTLTKLYLDLRKKKQKVQTYKKVTKPNP